MANEKRMIDASEFVKQLEEEFHGMVSDSELKVYQIISRIEERPTVDVVEVVHGWWIELPGMEPDYKCSECGQSYAWWEPSEAHYCPNCGARMDLPAEVDHESS